MDSLNAHIATGEYAYDVEGIQKLCDNVALELLDDSYAAVRDVYLPELSRWLAESI